MANAVYCVSCYIETWQHETFFLMTSSSVRSLTSGLLETSLRWDSMRAKHRWIIQLF